MDQKKKNRTCLQTRETRMLKQSIPQICSHNFWIDFGLKADYDNDVHVGVGFMKHSSHWTQRLLLFISAAQNILNIFCCLNWFNGSVPHSLIFENRGK